MSAAGAAPKSPSRYILSACFAFTTSGHAAALQSVAMNFRRPTKTATCLFPCEGRRRIPRGGHGTMSLLGPGCAKTFFLPQKLHATGDDPHRYDGLSIFLLYRVRSQPGCKLGPR